MIKGTPSKYLLIPNYCESFKIQPPVNRFIETKWIQNIIKKVSSENKSDNSAIPKYNIKFLSKS